MRTIEKLKLNQFSKSELLDREMGNLLGKGDVCCLCGCRYWDDPLGSSTVDNAAANNRENLETPGGGYASGDFY